MYCVYVAINRYHNVTNQDAKIFDIRTCILGTYHTGYKKRKITIQKIRIGRSIKYTHCITLCTIRMNMTSQSGFETNTTTIYFHIPTLNDIAIAVTALIRLKIGSVMGQRNPFVISTEILYFFRALPSDFVS